MGVSLALYSNAMWKISRKMDLSNESFHSYLGQVFYSFIYSNIFPGCPFNIQLVSHGALVNWLIHYLINSLSKWRQDSFASSWWWKDIKKRVGVVLYTFSSPSKIYLLIIFYIINIIIFFVMSQIQLFRLNNIGQVPKRMHKDSSKDVIDVTIIQIKLFSHR